MYRQFPKKDRVAIRTSLSFGWGFSAVSGLGGMFLTPDSVVQELGPVFPVVSAAMMVVASLAAIFGVVANRYQTEWVAAWFASAGLFAYLVVVAAFVFSNPQRLQQAAALASLLGFYVYRITMCSAHARRQRRIHELMESGEVTLPNAVEPN